MKSNMIDDKSVSKIQKERIWELDALRGLFIICVIFVHLIFDLEYFFGIISSQDLPDIFTFIQVNGGILFILLSGICVTLGSKSIKRGLIVLAGAAIVTIVSLCMGSPDLYIFFGILHLLAFCMLTYPLYKKAPTWLIFIIGAIAIAVGIYFTGFLITYDTQLECHYIESPYWFWLGLINRSFVAGDYFPILPNVGYFMMGIVLGRTLYKNKHTLFPKFPHENFVIKFLSWCGRNSLFIYLGHQPLLYGGCMLADLIINK